jgi:hypothetical protein
VTTIATSWWNPDCENGEARECYVRWENGIAVKGCAYESAYVFDQRFADMVLALDAAKRGEHAQTA